MSVMTPENEKRKEEKPEATNTAEKSLVERLTLWIGVTGSVITMMLTLYNYRTKTQIDDAEARLKVVQADVATKAEQREAFKEKVSRYTWIRSLFPDLVDEKDEKKRNFTVSLVRLSLEPKEAEDLFAALQASASKELQIVGRTGLNAIENEQVTELADRINQINADTAEIRKRTVADLLRGYKSSSQAITLVLKLYDEGKIEKLSASGLINGIVFLNGTDASAWNRQQIQLADEVIARIKAKEIGPQTQGVLRDFESHLAEIRASQTG